MKENEIWLPIEGYENLYQVSNLGQVKSLNYNHTKQEKILRQRQNKYGYMQVNLYKDKKRETFQVHRLVATAFIPNTNGYRCVNHKDEDKTNNCVDNLEWCTHKYNSNHGTCQQRRVANTDYKSRTAKIDYKARTAKIDYKAISERLINRQDLSKQVYQYSLDGTLVAIYPSTREAGRNGFCKSHVSECCIGKLKHYKGFIWSYEEIKKGE